MVWYALAYTGRVVCVLQLAEPLVMYLTIELLHTIEVLHACKIIHGDLKPDNILFYSL